VLVVDDVAANRDIAVSVLSLAGLRTVEARDGAEALAAVHEHRPDLILMDMLMPVMDGVQAIRRIRDTPGLSGTPILAVSASSYHRDRERALQAGADGFLPKPLNFNRLFEQVGQRLNLAWTYRGDAGAQRPL
jgi:CheY-like chemotaxis protein